jgi:alkylation response protein AidB-like acyl-CoA dehydrogenase
LQRFGNEKLREKYLPKMASSSISSFCISEANSGSDAFSLKTRADPSDGNFFKISGTKMWISNSFEADLFFVFANVDPSKGYKGITCFLIEKEWGVEIGAKEKKVI